MHEDAWRDSYDSWKTTPPDEGRDGYGVRLTGQRRLDADISLLLLTLATHDDLARFWAMQAMRSARRLGLWPRSL